MSNKNLFLILLIGTLINIFVYSYFNREKITEVILIPLVINCIAAFIFYLLFVYFPRKKRVDLIKYNFRNNFLYFKKNIIELLLQIVGRIADKDLVEKLENIEQFRDYFKQSFSEEQTLWHRIMNALETNNKLEHSILFQLKLLREEVLYVLNNIQINDEQVFRFFKVLSERIYQIENDEHYDENVRALTNFLWEVFTGWSFVEGYPKKDIFEAILARLNDNFT